MKTKNKILIEALAQFNSCGIEVVTTRHIAQSLNMSQGNLHYHFPNKDVVIKALFEDFLKELQANRKNNPDQLFEKEQVYSSMKVNYQIMWNYRFFFLDNETVWRRLPELKKQILQVLEAKKQEIKGIIEIYVQQGVFRKNISQGQIEFLAQQFIFTIASWLNAAVYLNINENTPSYFASFTFRTWLPYLSKAELKKWENLLIIES